MEDLTSSVVDPDTPDLRVLTPNLERIRARFGVDTVVVLLLDQSREDLVAQTGVGVDEDLFRGIRVPVGHGFAGRVAELNRPIAEADLAPGAVVNPLLHLLGVVSVLGVPLRSHGDVIGVLHIGSTRRHTFGDEQIQALEGDANAVADLIEHQRVLAHRVTAQTLRASLAPRLPDVPGLDLAARYLPNGDYGVGGDWYDVFTLDDTRVAITIGDVMGHGLHAATVMGRVRSALRAYLMIEDDPGRVLTLLDRKMQRFDVGELTTVVLGVLDTVTGLLRVSRAGHLPPLVVAAGESAVELGAPADLPLGVDETPGRQTTDLMLAKGTALCLFSDGLVDAKFGDIDQAIRRLRDVLSRHAGKDAEQLCVAIMSEVSEGRQARDDVSLLVLRRLP